MLLSHVSEQEGQQDILQRSCLYLLSSTRIEEALHPSFKHLDVCSKISKLGSSFAFKIYLGDDSLVGWRDCI